ncbi:Beta-lactamase superfamily domain protein [uncultured archaeon]|nr:Beta-lactamase superfamily domain protein [uncultured archaeon]
MIVTWMGHSCFLLQSAKGLKVLLDPFQEEEVGYALPDLEADIVTVSHDHGDHNNFQAAGCHSHLIRGPGRHIAKDLELRGIKSYHDGLHGKLRGANTIFCFMMDGISVCHLGDLGHILSARLVREIGPVDLLFLPVGGRYTIDSREAEEVRKLLGPKISVPMHYKTAALSFELDDASDFLRGHEILGPLENLELEKENLQTPGKRGLVVLLACAAAEMDR